MTKEEKELLILDLCARLPYKCKYKASKDITHWHKLTLSTGTIDKIIDDYYDDIKPYLRLRISMTEEEKEEYHKLCDSYYGIFFDSVESIDWLLSHHFDFRGLIGKGLAIEAPEGMYN